MAEINPTNLEHLETLISQSMRGMHFLFDRSAIVRVLRGPTEERDFFNLENLSRVQELFTILVNKQSLAEKRAFLDSLDSKSHELLLRTYFHILDNSLLATNQPKH